MRKKKLHREPTKNYFPLPNVIYQLGLSAGAIAVYGYLFYIENRETYQCHASYTTIGNAVGMSRNTVRKYVQELEHRRLILTERTTIVTRDGRTENTNRISKLMFKWSVELNMMMHIVAAHFKDDVSDLRALRGYSADEVKRTYGNISFDTALDIQRGNFDD